MELSEQLFMEITGVRVSTPIYETAPEKRRHTRVAFGERARIFPLMEMETGNGSPVLVRDLSRSGVGFQINDELTVGDEFVLQLRKQTQELVHLQCIVQRCEAGGTGLVQFVVGATFELVLTEAQWKPPKAVPQVRPVPMSRKQATAAAMAVAAAGVADGSDSTKLRSRLSSLSGLNNAASAPVAAEPVLLVEPAPAVSSDQLAAARTKLFAAAPAESILADAPAETAAESPAVVEPVIAAPIQKACIKPLPPLEPLPEVPARLAPETETVPTMTVAVEPTTVPQIDAPKVIAGESKPAEAMEETDMLIEEANELVESDESIPAVAPNVVLPAVEESVVAEPTPTAPIEVAAAAPIHPAAAVEPAMQVVAPIATVTSMPGNASPMLVLVIPAGSIPAGQQSITVNAAGVSVTVTFASAPAAAQVAAQTAVEFATGVTADSMFDLLAESLGDESVDAMAA